jgi:hypothetical protein
MRIASEKRLVQPVKSPGRCQRCMMGRGRIGGGRCRRSTGREVEVGGREVGVSLRG